MCKPERMLSLYPSQAVRTEKLRKKLISSYWWLTAKFTQVTQITWEPQFSSLWGQLEQQANCVYAWVLPCDSSSYNEKNVLKAQHKTVAQRAKTRLKEAPIPSRMPNKLEPITKPCYQNEDKYLSSTTERWWSADLVLTYSFHMASTATSSKWQGDPVATALCQRLGSTALNRMDCFGKTFRKLWI